MLNNHSFYSIAFGLLILLFLTDCNAKKKATQTLVYSPTPEWVDKKPIDPQYYYGIGKADKKYHSADYQQAAKKMALEDMASEIEVNLDAKSVLYQKENSFEYYETYQSTIKIEVTQNISGFEPVDSWNDENNYWVLYRLSKSKYEHVEAEKLNQAISKALHYIEVSESSQHYKKRLDNLILAMQSIKPYLNKPLKTSYNNSTIYLGNYITNKIEEMLEGLIIYGSKDKIDLNLKNCYATNANWSLQYNNLPISNFPVRIKFKTYSPQLVYSDENGIFSYNVAARYYDNTPPLIEAWISTTDLMDDQLILSLFNQKYAINRTDVELYKPVFLINSDNGKNVIQQEIIKAGGKVTNNIDEAGVILKFEFKVSDLGKADDFFTSKCEIIVSVIGKNEHFETQKSWPAVKGIQLNRASARDKAINNSIEQIGYRWFQQLISDLCDQ
jgi:hypothetical protein